MPNASLDSMTTSNLPQTPTIKVVDIDEGFGSMPMSELDSSIDESLLSLHYTPPQTPQPWWQSSENEDDGTIEKDQDEHQGASPSIMTEDDDIDRKLAFTSRAHSEERRQWRIERSQSLERVNEWFKETSMESVESTVILASYRLESSGLAQRRTRSYIQRSYRRAPSLPSSILDTSKSPSTIGFVINAGLDRLNEAVSEDDTSLNVEELTYRKTYSALQLHFRPHNRVSCIILFSCAFWLHSVLFTFFLAAIGWRFWTNSLLLPRAPVLHSKLMFCNLVLMMLSCLHFRSREGAIALRSLQEYVDDWTSGWWLLRVVELIVGYLVAKFKTWPH